MHDNGPRRDGPYVVFDCTAVPASLVEAELFGHERGAFTTALATRKGVFEQADGGTLLIDEIGDLDLALQPKLLRAIERSEIRRIGGDKWIQVDVRVLAATRRDLDREVQHGRFRDDLFHRMSVGRIELPPLRRRHGDVPLLAQQFWTELGGQGRVPAELMARWADDPWPGNTRELKNAIARQLAVGDLTGDDGGATSGRSVPPGAELVDVVGRVLAERLPLPMARLRVVEELERRYIEQVLAEHGGSVARAAEASGIGRRYFQMIRGRVKKR
jgi:transcriptional regulator with GAF, ATPase, and Fis domain